MLQLLLDPKLVLFSQSLPPGLGQEELQGHIWGLLGLGGISLGSARSPCMHTAVEHRGQHFQQNPITRATARTNWPDRAYSLDRDSEAMGAKEKYWLCQ